MKKRNEKEKTKKKNHQLSLHQRNALEGYLFLAPWLVGLALFTLFPVVYSVILSMSDVQMDPTGIKTRFVGIQWYREAFTLDTTFPVSLLDTMKFVLLSTPMIVVSALLLALLLNGKFRGRSVFRGVFFLPVVIISGPVIQELLTTRAAAVIHPESFIIYDFIASLPVVLSAPLLYIFDNIVLILWFSGVQVVLFLAGLQKIGQPIREAASIDGASPWQMFWKIDLPFFFFLILLNTIYTLVQLSAFSSNEVNQEVVNKMTLVGKTYGYSAALSWIYFACMLLVIGAAFLVLRDRKEKAK